MKLISQHSEKKMVFPVNGSINWIAIWKKSILSLTPHHIKSEIIKLLEDSIGDICDSGEEWHKENIDKSRKIWIN